MDADIVFKKKSETKIVIYHKSGATESKDMTFCTKFTANSVVVAISPQTFAEEKMFTSVEVKSYMTIKEGSDPIIVTNLICPEFRGDILPFSASDVKTIRTNLDSFVMWSAQKNLKAFAELEHLVLDYDRMPQNTNLLDLILNLDKNYPPNLKSLIVNISNCYWTPSGWTPEFGILTAKTLPTFLNLCSKFELNLPPNIGIHIKNQTELMRIFEEAPKLKGEFENLVEDYKETLLQREALKYMMTKFSCDEFEDYLDPLEGVFESGYCLLQAKPSDEEIIKTITDAYLYIKNIETADGGSRGKITSSEKNSKTISICMIGCDISGERVNASELVKYLNWGTSVIIDSVNIENDFVYNPDASKNFMILNRLLITPIKCLELKSTKPIIIVSVQSMDSTHLEVFSSAENSSVESFTERVKEAQREVDMCVHMFVTSTNKKSHKQDLEDAKYQYCQAYAAYKKCMSFMQGNHELIPFVEGYEAEE
jgi:hypothetical protein